MVNREQHTHRRRTVASAVLALVMGGSALASVPIEDPVDETAHPGETAASGSELQADAQKTNILRYAGYTLAIRPRTVAVRLHTPPREAFQPRSETVVVREPDLTFGSLRDVFSSSSVQLTPPVRQRAPAVRPRGDDGNDDDTTPGTPMRGRSQWGWLADETAARSLRIRPSDESYSAPMGWDRRMNDFSLTPRNAGTDAFQPAQGLTDRIRVGPSDELPFSFDALSSEPSRGWTTRSWGRELPDQR